MKFVREITHNQQDQQVSSNGQVLNSYELLKVNADTQSNKTIVAIWCSFFIIVGSLYILTLAVPTTFIKDIKENIDCPPEFENSIDPQIHLICQSFSKSNPNYGGVVKDMSNLNQFLSIGLIFFKLPAQKDEEFTFDLIFDGHFYEFDSSFQEVKKFDTQTPHTITINCPKRGYRCDEVLLLYHGSIESPNYAFALNFKNMEKWVISDQLKFTSNFVNSDYTVFLITLRYTCLVISIIMTISFIRKLQRIALSHWVIEQKLLVFLSGLLILFNNPFYALTILIQNMASAFFEVLFIVNFFIFLLFFIWVILERVLLENGMKKSTTIDLKKILFSVFLYFFLLVTYLGFSFSHQQDPYTNFNDSFGGFYDICKIVGIFLLSVYFFAILISYCKICRVFTSRIWRNKLFTLFSMYYILSIALFAFSGTLDIYSTVGGRALLFITILNLYVYYLQYMYSFSPEGFYEAAQLINLEIGTQPQIYEILDDSLHGIDAENNDKGIEKPFFLNKQKEQEMADDIFQEHQQINEQIKLQDQQFPLIHQDFKIEKHQDAIFEIENDQIIPQSHFEKNTNNNINASGNIKKTEALNKSKNNNENEIQNKYENNDEEGGDLVLNFDEDDGENNL